MIKTTMVMADPPTSAEMEPNWGKVKAKKRRTPEMIVRSITRRTQKSGSRSKGT